MYSSQLLYPMENCNTLDSIVIFYYFYNN